MNLISNNETISMKNYIITGIICIPIIIGFVHWYNIQTKYKKIIDKKKQIDYITIERPYWILAIMVIVLFILWLFLPIVLSSLLKNNSSENYENQGISDQEILKNNQKNTVNLYKQSPVKKKVNRNRDQFLF